MVRMNFVGGYAIEAVKDLSEVLALRGEWQRMTFLSANRRTEQGGAMDPAVDIDFYLTEMRSGNGTLRPHVLVLRRNGVVQTILVGRLENRPFQESLGYKKVSYPPVRVLTFIHCGMLGEDSDENASVLLDSIKESLREHEADVVLFYGMDLDSRFYEVAKNEGDLLTRDRCPALMRRWRIRLPASYEELLHQLSSNTRHKLKRYSKRLRDAFADQLTVRSYRNPDDVDRILADTEVIATKTYQRGLGVGFSQSSSMRQRMTLAATQGWLRAHILYAADKPVAYWNGSLYHRTFFTWTTGYDPDLGNLRPGTFLLQGMLQELCNENAADRVDFGFGDAQYKRDWCDHEHFQASLFLFAPTLQGVFLSLFHNSLVSASNVTRRLLERTKIAAKLKRAWRNRLVTERIGN